MIFFIKNHYLGGRNAARFFPQQGKAAKRWQQISMKIVKFTLIVSILVTVFSCKQAEVPAEEIPLPISTFDAPFPKNNKQLSRIFGKLLLVKNNNDTIFLKITSTKNDNLIIDGKSGDTIFYGKVCKFREFYYFSQKENDSSYYISAFKIKGNLIYGLNRWSQYYDIDENIIKGNGKELVKSINADTSAIRLKPNKRELKKLFGIIMSKVIPDTILNSKTDLTEIAKRESTFEKEADEIANKIKVYPNPATDFINVQVSQESIYQLIDFNGKIVQQGKLLELENRIDVSSKQAGVYFLNITDLQKNEKQSVKIIVQ